MIHTTHEKYVFYLLLVISIILSFLIFKPFLIVIVLGASFSVAIHPIFSWMLRKITSSRAFAAFLTMVMFILVIGGPIFGIGALVFKQSQALFNSPGNSIVSPVVDTISGVADVFLPEEFDVNVPEMAKTFVGSISSNLANIFTSTLSTILSIFLMILSMFFFLKDGEIWKNFLLRLSPMSDTYDKTIIKELKATVDGVVKGYLLIALIQGILMGIGLMIFQVPNAALWGLVAGISALVPTIGTAIVAVPVVIYLYTSGDTTSAMGFLAWSIIVVGLVDNMLNPIIIGRKINIHPLLILFSVLGGIALFGPAGILMGPLSVSLLYTLGNIYMRKFEKSSN